MRAEIVLALCLSLACGAASAQNAIQKGGAKKRVVCWTDEHGQRACGDAVPPQAVPRERQVLDAQGRVVQTIPAALTPAQLAEKAAAAERAAVEKRAAEKQATYDRSLLDTYTGAEEMAALRDNRLSAIDTSMALAEASARREEETLAGARERLDKARAQKREPATLVKRIKEYETALVEYRRKLDGMRAQRTSLCESFDKDLSRYRELKPEWANFQSPCPAPGTLSALK